jgi:hypothetical protein
MTALARIEDAARAALRQGCLPPNQARAIIAALLARLARLEAEIAAIRGAARG